MNTQLITMKKTIKNAALLAVVTAAFVSCSKDQAAVGKLAGDWWLTSKTVATVEMVDTAAEYAMYHFENCDLADRNCNGYMTGVNKGSGMQEVHMFTYMVHEDAANLHFYWTPMLGAAAGEVHCDITAQEKDMVTFSYMDMNGAEVVETLKRGKALEE